MSRLINMVSGGLVGLACFAGMVWFMIRRLKKSDNPGGLVSKWIISGIVLLFLVFRILPWAAGGGYDSAFAVPFAAACGILLGLIWAPNIAAMVSKPLASLYDGGDAEVEARPCLSLAEARRKKGLYEEAIEEIQKELAKFPENFAGNIMLASVYAEDMKDLDAALAILEQVLNQPGRSPDQVAYSLNRIADWQLKFRQDTVAARAVLARIVELYPGSEQAQVAHQKLAHMRPPEPINPTQTRAPIALPHGEENIGLRDDFAGLMPPQEDPEAATAILIRHLEEFPQDWEARENLALLYAEHYQRVDLAVDQLEQLIAQPGQPAKKVVHWLNMEADLRIKYGGQVEAARAALERIRNGYPNSAMAETARNRLARLVFEIKAKDASATVKMGSYENNLGLKAGGPPRRPA